MFWFIGDEGAHPFEGKSWATYLDAWLELVPAAGRFHEILGQVAVLEELTAADYVHSDALDLDHLSSRGPGR